MQKRVDRAKELHQQRQQAEKLEAPGAKQIANWYQVEQAAVLAGYRDNELKDE